MKKKDKIWQEQLITVLKDSEGYDQDDDYPFDESSATFGKNVDWKAKDVRKYINKLEKLGATNIQIPDEDTIKLTLPSSMVRTSLKNRSEILLHVMTTSPHPCDVEYNKKKDQLEMQWDW